MVEYTVEMPDFTEAERFQEQVHAKIQQLSGEQQETQVKLAEHINIAIAGEKMGTTSDEFCVSWYREWVGYMRSMEATQQKINEQTMAGSKKYSDAVDALLSRMGAAGWPFVNLVGVSFSENSRDTIDVFIFAKSGSYNSDDSSVEYTTVDLKEFEQTVSEAQEKIMPDLQKWMRTEAQILPPQQSAQLIAKARVKIAKQAVLNFLNTQNEDGWMFVRFMYNDFLFKKNKA